MKLDELCLNKLEKLKKKTALWSHFINSSDFRTPFDIFERLSQEYHQYNTL